MEANLEENRNSYFGKIRAKREPNIQSVRRCLRHVWRGQDFFVFARSGRVYINSSSKRKRGCGFRAVQRAMEYRGVAAFAFPMVK